MTQSNLLKPLLVAGAVAILTGLIGGMLTTIGPWYDGLIKPSWQPPNWLFGPVWTLIYACCAVSGALAWRAAPAGSVRLSIVGLFLITALLNVMWSAFFFTMERPDIAVWECGFLLVSIIALLFGVTRFSRPAGWLLVPYLVWVSFALFLNFTIVRLNAPFI